MTTNAIDIEKIKAADYAHLVHPLFHPVDQKDPFVRVKGEGTILYESGGKQYIVVTTGRGGGSPWLVPDTITPEINPPQTGFAMYVYALPDKK